MGKIQSQADKIEFVTEATNLVALNTEKLTAAKFDPTEKVGELKAHIAAVDDAATVRNNARQVSKEATTAYNKTLKEAYKETSALVNMVEGALGSDDPLVQSLKDLRN